MKPAVQWFFHQFRHVPCAIQSIPLGFEVRAEGICHHYLGESVDEAVMEFLGVYLEIQKRASRVLSVTIPSSLPVDMSVTHTQAFNGHGG